MDTCPVCIIFDKPVPDELMLILGDAIHNLRTALDHATWELAGYDGTQDDKTQFPFPRSNQKDYEGWLRRIIPAAPQDTIDLFMDLAAYRGGRGSPLFELHRLDIDDKHLVIVPVIERCRVSGIRLKRQDMNTGEVVETSVPDTDVDIAMEDVGYHIGQARGLGFLGQGLSVTRNPLGDSVQLDDDLKIAPSIFFRDVQPFPGEPILPTLLHLSDLVREVIWKFQSLIAER